MSEETLFDYNNCLKMSFPHSVKMLVALSGSVFWVYYFQKRSIWKTAIADPKHKHTLRFNTGGTFKIMQVTDIHFGHADEETDVKSQELLSKLIDMEKPDLVVNSGDLISAHKWDKKTPKWIERQYAKFTSVMEAKK
jgi:predicted MPP superfamily phosphohydrolase